MALLLAVGPNMGQVRGRAQMEKKRKERKGINREGECDRGLPDQRFLNDGIQ